eukprot:7595500-Karenia_brevis.AAC.1
MKAEPATSEAIDANAEAAYYLKDSKSQCVDFNSQERKNTSCDPYVSGSHEYDPFLKDFDSQELANTCMSDADFNSQEQAM